jgi:hypothetical protein
MASTNGDGHAKKRRPSAKKATAAPQAALKKYLEMTGTHVSPERVAKNAHPRSRHPTTDATRTDEPPTFPDEILAERAGFAQRVVGR